MHRDEDFEFAKRMSAWGLNDCQVSRLTGISRTTIRDWRSERVRSGTHPRRSNYCPVCGSGELNDHTYAFLLGLYLGDGCIATQARGVFRLRISLDDKYPGIIKACEKAITGLLSNHALSAGRNQCMGCTEVYSYWKHWPCVFPQHGVGPKHLRRIKLAQWQQKIVNAHPDHLLRGLIHSDGFRGLNRIRKKGARSQTFYAYPRYGFTNNSGEIRRIFCDACEALGVAWRQMNWKTIAVSRRADVARLDRVVGPKT